MSTSSVSNTVSSDVLNAVNTRSTKSTTATDDMHDQFLTMLTTQLKNQDPMNPMDNSQMTTQLAQINMVDGINKVNTTLQAMVDNYSASQANAAASMVGRAVLVDGSKLQLADGSSVGGFDLTSAADNVKVSVLDSNGSVVATLDLGAADAGSHLFTWDGTTDSGATAANGTYTLKVNATQGGTAVSASSLQLGTVTSVIRNGNTAELQVGGLGTFQMSDIKQILS